MKTVRDKTVEMTFDKRNRKLQVLLAEIREAKDSKSALAILDLLETAWNEESLLQTKVSILMLSELERIRMALEDPYHVQYARKKEQEEEAKEKEQKS